MLVMAMVLTRLRAGTTARASDDLIRYSKQKQSLSAMPAERRSDLFRPSRRKSSWSFTTTRKSHKVNLDGADLRETNLSFTTLQGASLRGLISAAVVSMGLIYVMPT